MTEIGDDVSYIYCSRSHNILKRPHGYLIHSPPLAMELATSYSQSEFENFLADEFKVK